MLELIISENYKLLGQCPEKHYSLLYISGVSKHFWFKPPFTFKMYHVLPPSTVSENKVTSCNK
jgi:hypothetical protein